MQKPFLTTLALLVSAALILLLTHRPGAVGGWHGAASVHITQGQRRQEAPVRVPLPEIFRVDFVIYLRPEGGHLPDEREIRSRVMNWLVRHATGPLCPALRPYVQRGLLEIRVQPKTSLPTPPMELLRLSAGAEELRRYQRATHLVLLSATEMPGPPHAGLWCAIAVSRAVAATYSGVILDPERSELLPVASHLQPLPVDPSPRLVEHITVPFSVDERGLGWLTTTGMRKFGLPDLQIKDAPPNLQSQLCLVMNGVAHVLLVTLAMEAAHQRAVRELPQVKRRFQAGLPPGAVLWVKNGFPTSGNGNEYMWVVVNTWTGGQLTGQLDSTPELRHDLRAGQTVQLEERGIFDWLLQLPDGRTEGNYTSDVVQREGRRHR